MPATLYRGLGVIDHNGDLIGDSLLVEDGVIRGFTRRGYSSEKRVEGYILPGFIDAHLHVKGIGVSIYGVDLRGSRDGWEVAQRLSRSTGRIAIGRGWNQEEFTRPGLPVRKLLDKAVPDRPAVAIRVCGHMATVNTAALDYTRPWTLYPDQVDRENGVLVEDAVYYVVNKLLELLDEVELVRLGLESLVNAGIRGVSSMACSPGEVEALKEIYSRGGPGIRVSCYASRQSMKYLGLSVGGFSVVGVKLFADGSLGARTAALRSDYEDDPGNRGRLLMTWRDIVDTAGEVLRRGYRVAIHAIGDRALDEVIEAYRRLEPGEAARVEHASIAWDSQIKELAGLGVYVVIQPGFRQSDWWIGKRLGSRAGLAYRFRKLLDSGARMAISTDAPVEDYRPWVNYGYAVGDCSCSVGEDLSRREALRLYTVEAARASGGPVSVLGRIEPGAPSMLSWSPGNPLSDGWRGPLRPLG